MITLELGRVELWVAVGALFALAVGLVLVGTMLWRQHRQLKHSLNCISAEVSVFSEASISVAQTVEQSLVVAPRRSANLDGGTSMASRSELLQLAARRLAQHQDPALVQQTLGVKDEELRLLQVGAASAQVALQPQQPRGEQDVESTALRQPGAPRAVA